MLRQTLAAAATHYRSAAVVRSRLGAVAGKRAMSSSQGEEAAVLAAVHDVLEAAGTGDWAKYEPLCDKDITCFEPESVGNVAKGLPFHKFYFNMPAGPAAPLKPNTTLADVHVRLLGGDKTSAVVVYNRLVQKLGVDGPFTVKSNETRVMEKDASTKKWKCVHFHRSPA